MSLAVSLINGLVALGGLIVGAFGMWLAYKARISRFQEILYEKRAEGCQQVLIAVSDLYNVAQHFIHTNLDHVLAKDGPWLDDNMRVQLRTTSASQSSALLVSRQKWALFLPKELERNLDDFIRTFNAISAHPNFAQSYPTELVRSRDPGLELGKAYVEVIRAARKSLAVEPLEEETLKLLSKPNESEQELAARDRN